MSKEQEFAEMCLLDDYTVNCQMLGQDYLVFNNNELTLGNNIYFCRIWLSAPVEIINSEVRKTCVTEN